MGREGPAKDRKRQEKTGKDRKRQGDIIVALNIIV
jgi:hypothetical protein